MLAATASESLQSIRIEKDIYIAAPLEIAFEALLEELGPASEGPPGQPMPLVLEAHPGGRWFRDLGNNAGHLWGHVQVIKPPTLLEIIGPMFMSYPCANHLQYRLAAEGLGTRLKLLHRAFGEIPPEHSEGVQKGWESKLNRARDLAESRSSSK